MGGAEGLLAPSVVSCDNLVTVPLTLLDRPSGRLDRLGRIELDRALRYALDIIY